METSGYFERTLFYDRSPASDEYYVRCADFVFEKDPRLSKVEVRVQTSVDVAFYERKQEQATQDKAEKRASDETQSKNDGYPVTTIQSPKCPKSGRSEIDDATLLRAEASQDSDEEDAWSLSSKASSTALPEALDQHRGSCPPTYPGPPKLAIVDLDTERLRSFIKSTKHDFRVFYLRQRHSYSRLQITKEYFEQLLKSCHVFPRFNEYVIGFGVKNNESEVGPPPLKFRLLCNSDNQSHQGFECAYILRYIEFTNRPRGRRPWSLRQFAVYHRYKPKTVTNCSTWILVGASQRTEVRLDQYTRSIDDLTGSNPFELHVVFLDTAIASWRPYLVDLEKLVTFQSKKAAGIRIVDDVEEDFIMLDVDDHQELKQIEDQIADLILCLDSTLDTVSTFQEIYDRFAGHQDSPLRMMATASLSTFRPDGVVFALKEKAKEIAYTRKKAEALLSKVQNTRTLISSLLERRSGHNLNQQISALEKLEKQGQDENAIMRQLAEKNSRDSSSMRILTIITMIYLPCTIVSNFFSTQFVTQQDSPSGGTKLGYAQNAWLFFAISVPLTLLTILIWWLWVNFEKIRRLFHDPASENVNASKKSTGVLEYSRSLTDLPL